MEIKEKDLKDGTLIIFQTKDKDDLREAELSFSTRSGMFTIWFNGAIIHLSKTFRPMLKRLDKLKTDWDLEFNRTEL